MFRHQILSKQMGESAGLRQTLLPAPPISWVRLLASEPPIQRKALTAMIVAGQTPRPPSLWLWLT